MILDPYNVSDIIIINETIKHMHSSLKIVLG